MSVIPIQPPITPCPTCGRCPTCGQYRPTTPYQFQPYWWWSSGTTTSTPPNPSNDSPEQLSFDFTKDRS